MKGNKIMKLVKVCLYAEGYYSEATYEDNIWIKKSTYEKLKDKFPLKIACGELDGKHSDVYGDVEIQDEWETDEDYAKAGIAECDGEILEDELKELYEDNGFDWNKEQKKIKKYFDGLDVWEEVTINIPASKKAELMDFVETLKNKN